MKTTGKTAGKTATNTKNTKSQGWRETRRKGERVIIDPAGHIYHGTARDVRECALTPSARDMLAESLQIRHHLRSKGIIDGAELRELCAGCRRDAILTGRALRLNPRIEVPPATLIRLQAGARLLGYTWPEFLEELWSSEVESLLDYAWTETGKKELPLTRHERAALARLEAAAV